MKRALVIVVLLGLVAAGGFVFWRRSAQPTTAFRTTQLKRGDLLVTISATGTVEPEEVVDVGAQVAGRIASFGQDLNAPDKIIDYGSEVERGTVLARIDDALYTADVASNEAQLEQAQANVSRAQADLESRIAAQAQAEAGVELATITYDQLKTMPGDAQSSIELQTAGAALRQAKAALATASANVAVGRAAVTQAESAVAQASAALQRVKTNLDYCTIRSPVKGVIIDRRVNIGQTVVASLSAPSLFLIAKDLTRMQVWASVNEADIGNIRPSQNVNFTVDAYPGQTFHGEVGKVRLNASMTQNVVTYTVEITTDNSDGRLLPYLTANVQFEVTRRDDVLMVPNAALRWTPTAQQVVPAARQGWESSDRRRSPATRPVATGSGATSGVSQPGTIWVQDGDHVRPIAVRTGLSDGSVTEIQGEDLREGLEIIMGEAVRGAAGAPTVNPFTPQVFGSRRPQ